jgi:hypothetical protein
MTDSATLRSWLEGLGLEVNDAGDHLSVMPGDDADLRLMVRRSDASTWEVVHDRRVEESVLTSDWHAPWDTDPAAVVVGRAVDEVALGFPLVQSETTHHAGAAAVRFRAPLFDEGLSRQACALTVSSVLNAARVFDLVLARRVEERAAWEEFEATSDQRERERRELIDRMTGTAPTAAAAVQPPTGPPRMGSRQPPTGQR